MPLTAPELLGSDSGLGSSTMTVNPSRNIAAGETLAVLIAERDNGLSGVADNSAQAGTANSYSKIHSYEGNDPYVYVYLTKTTRAILSTDTITVTQAGSGGGQAMVVLALPDADTSPLDQTGSNHFGGGTGWGGGTTGTTAQADEYALGVAAFAEASIDAGTITSDSPWTQEFDYAPTGGEGYAAVFGAQVLTATGTTSYSGDWGATSDGLTSNIVVTLKGTPSGGGGTTINSSPDGTIFLDGSATSDYSSSTVHNSSPNGTIQVCGNAISIYSRIYGSSPQGTIQLDGSAVSSFSSGSTTYNSSPDGTIILGGLANSAYSAGVSVFHPAIHGGWF